MSILKSLAVALALVFAAIPAAMADQPADRGDTPGLGWGAGGNHSVGVPGPVAGVGLPILAVAGGLVWILARRRRADRTGP
ncbi:MAG: hypothetical protein ACTHLT_06430 [Devosia sp.]